MAAPRALVAAGVLTLWLIAGLGSCQGQADVEEEQLNGGEAQPSAREEGRSGKKEVHNPLELFFVHNARVKEGTDVRIWTNTTELTRSGTWVDVWWSNVSDPRLDDLVALYIPADADPRKNAPIKLQFAFRSPTHRSIGAGHLRFKVLNLRQDMLFMFIRGGLQFPVAVAKTGVIRNTNPNEPLQGHLSLTGRPGELVVQWVTRDIGNPLVRWGTEPGRYTHAAPATSITYTREELCGAPATGSGWAEPGMLHAAVVSGLVPRQTYYYVFGDEEFGWSGEGSFRGPPPAGRNTAVRVLAVADMGQAEPDNSNEATLMLASRNTTTRLAAEAASGTYDLLVHNGDISYARGYSSQWDAFFHQLGPVVQRLPYMTTIGNHERDWPETGDRFPTQYDSGGECGVPYYRRTRMPTPSEDQHWYSFDLGPIHFLQYSTEHEFEPGSVQHRFIEEDLKAVDRSATPWVVVGGHRPMYVDSTFGWPPDGDIFVADQLRASLEPLFQQYGVDVTWHGHHHSYQRTCPVLEGRCVGLNADGSAAAPVHLVIGNAGFELTPNIHLHQPAIFEVVKLEYGYLRVTANATHMHHQMVSSSSGKILDEFNLTKPPDWVFTPRPAAAGETVGAAAYPQPQGAGMLASA